MDSDISSDQVFVITSAFVLEAIQVITESLSPLLTSAAYFDDHGFKFEAPTIEPQPLRARR